jgi:hypothetical protein
VLRRFIIWSALGLATIGGCSSQPPALPSAEQAAKEPPLAAPQGAHTSKQMEVPP